MNKTAVFIRHYKVTSGVLLYLFISIVIDQNYHAEDSHLQLTLLLSPLIILLTVLQHIYSVKINLLEHEVKKNLQDLKQAYILDKLTGLPNRLQLLEDQKHYPRTSLILVNIDRFKEVNEIYGTSAGDQILAAIAQEIKDWAADKPLQVYKSHSDEFALLLNQDSHDKNAADKALTENIFTHWITDLLARLRNKKITVDDQEIRITASAGIVVDSEHPNTEADRALRKAKSELKEWYIYNETLSTEDNYLNNQKMLAKIKTALENNNIKTYFQPIAEPDNSDIKKYESLVRLHTEDGEVITHKRQT